MNYSKHFYKYCDSEARHSAEEIIPILLETIAPDSVVDVGCGLGSWLSVFNQYGIQDILGIDGGFLDKKTLVISESNFIEQDITRPLSIDRKFDLVVSLEVAEHLPPASADTFVESLCKLGDIVLFSAAIPYQGGTHHVNEQWQDYWVRAFQRRGYIVVDYIRPKIWNNKKIAFFYTQNLLLYIKKNKLKNYPLLTEYVSDNNWKQICIVHPQQYLEAIERMQPENMCFSVAVSYAKRILTVLPFLFWKAVKRKL